MQKSENFPLKVQKLQKIRVFFSKKILKALIWTRRMQFWHPLAKVFSQKPKIIWSKYWEDWKTITFPQKNFSICFIGHLNCGFGSRIVNCLLNAIKNSPQMTKFLRSRQKNYNKIIIFKKCFSSKTSPGHVEWSSEKHTAIYSAINLGNLLLKVRQIFPQGTRGTKKPFVFSLFLFFSKSSPGHAECTFGKPCRTLFAQVPNFFNQSTKLVRNLLFSNFFSKNFSGHVDWSFGNPAVNVCQKSTMILLKVEKDFKNHPFFNENCSQKSSGHAECSFHNPCRIVLPRVENFLPKVQALLEKRFFFKKFISN